MTEAGAAAGAGEVKPGAGVAGGAAGGAAEGGAAAGAGAATAGAGAGAGTGDKGGAGLLAGEAGEGGEGGAGGAAPQTWPDDWRERQARAIAGKDEAAYEKTLGRLKRFASPENVTRSWFESDQKIRTGQFKRTLAADATAEEITAYRKENGIPDAPEGYELKIPGVEEVGEADKAVLGHFAGVFHKLNLPAPAAKGLVEAFYAHQNELANALRTNAREATINNRAALRSEWGKDFQLNQRLGDDLMIATLGEEEAPKLGALVLTDGTRLGDHPLFAKFVVQAARAQADDTTIVNAELGGDGGGSAKAQYDALIAMSVDKPEEYAKPENQSKLMRLAGVISRQKGKAA